MVTGCRVLRNPGGNGSRWDRTAPGNGCGVRANRRAVRQGGQLEERDLADFHAAVQSNRQARDVTQLEGQAGPANLGLQSRRYYG